MKKILFLGLSFPDVKKHTHLYTDLINEFHNQGHDVLVIAPDEENRKSSELVLQSGIKILRVPTLGLFSGNKIVKGLSNILLSHQYKRAFKKHKIPVDFDLVLIPTPPITLIDFAVWIKKKSRAKLYLILRDIFPQNAVDLKMMSKGGFIYNYFRKKEIKLYQESDRIGCMSPANIDFVMKHNPEVDTSKLHLLPNWEKIYELPKDLNETAMREKYGLTDKMIAIFGGNIGLPQRVENIIHLAQASQELEDLVFFIVGRGT
ncbi:MAG: glycosyltransferase involved in cell wall biosynthesis, partial [Maribacter sp.]